MRNISANLKAAVKSGTIASVIKIECTNGNVFAYTDSELPITVDGLLYNPAPGLAKLKLHSTSEIGQVSNQTLESGWVDAPEEDLMAGLFDEATITVGWTSWKNPEYGQVITFKGRLGTITWDSNGFRADIFSYTKDLQRNLNIIYTPTCSHELYDTAQVGVPGFCGINAAAYTAAGSITSITATKWAFGISNVQPDSYYVGAKITFTSGFNNGLTFKVKKHASNVIELYLPTTFIVNVSDTFTITAGCDKTLATCKARFNNVINFGGFPSIQPQVQFR